MAVVIDGMDEIIKEFLVESTEGLDLLDRDLIALERDPSSRELLSEIFRAVHTIKGTSGVLGFPKLESIAHVGENLLSRLRDGKMTLNPALTSGLLAMVDALRQLLGEIDRNGNEGEVDYSGVVDILEKLLDHSLVDAPIVASPATPVGTAQTVFPSTSEPAAIEAVNVSSPASPVEPRNDNAKDGPGISGSSIRVDVGLLDKMMNLVGELVLARNQILQFTSSQTDPTVLSAAQRLNLITTELQESVMKTRMQPIGNVWNKFPRVVRDLALQFGKQVEIEMEGSDTELDKTIIEAIKDPLTHILRNAIDHGIELPPDRIRAGKPAGGRLEMRAFHEGGQVNIEIADDGAGIHLERVKQRALQRGLITPEQSGRIGDRELANLVFLPGFSTAEKVSNVSGRGVGMDVVKTNIEKIGGVVDLQTVAGKGTTLKIKIPLTLAIIPALIVTSGGERFAIPQVSLLELLRIQGGTRIEQIHGVPVYRLRGRLLPLVFLDRVLGLPELRRREESDAINIVVLQADGHPFGLVVDGISDTEEIVVKPLGKQLKGIACFAGATIMGDGDVALILDVLGIAQMAEVASQLSDSVDAQPIVQVGQTDSGCESWLLFRSPGGRRIALPLSQVSRLEEFPAERIERSAEGEVVQYRGEIMPLIRVSKLLNESSETRDLLPVVVFSHNQRSCGLVVERIEDITDEAVEAHSGNCNGWATGSAVIQQEVTDLMDLKCVMAPPGASFVVAGGD
jgi:two-component system chemotaxis sensor kinase CheA